MLTRTLTRLVVGVALVCATVAWSGWAYLNTVAAPHRFEDVAEAVVADPEARFELAGPLSDQIVEASGLDASIAPVIRQSVADALVDPRVSSDVAAAFGAVHARAVGVDDDRSSTVDGTALVSALREHLATTNPDLAALIPDTAFPTLHIPEYHPPLVASLRTIAVTITNALAVVAVALLAVALIIGDRRYTLRRVGVWAVVTGLLWAIGPRLVVFLAHRWTPDADATIDAAVGAATKVVTATATGLVIAGIVAIVAGQFVGSLAPLYDGTAPRTPTRRQQASRLPAGVTTGHPAGHAPGYQSPARVDTYVPSGTAMRQPPPAAATQRFPTADPTPVASGSRPPPPPPPPNPPGAADDFDPWAYFSQPAVPPPSPDLPERRTQQRDRPT